MAYQETQAAGQASPDTVESAIEAFDPVLSRLETIATRASNCSDRILGGRPQAVEGAEKAPSTNHLLFSIKCRRERLSRVVDHLESEINRIEGGLA